MPASPVLFWIPEENPYFPAKNKLFFQKSPELTLYGSFQISP